MSAITTSHWFQYHSLLQHSHNTAVNSGPAWSLCLLSDYQVSVNGGAAHGRWHFQCSPPILCISVDFNNQPDVVVEYQFARIENTECYWQMQVGDVVCSSAILLPHVEKGRRRQALPPPESVQTPVLQEPAVSQPPERTRSRCNLCTRGGAHAAQQWSSTLRAGQAVDQQTTECSSSRWQAPPLTSASVPRAWPPATAIEQARAIVQMRSSVLRGVNVRYNVRDDGYTWVALTVSAVQAAHSRIVVYVDGHVSLILLPPCEPHFSHTFAEACKNRNNALG